VRHRRSTNASDAPSTNSTEDTFDEGHVSMPSSAIYPNRTRDAVTHSDIPSCLSGFPNQSIDALLNDGINNERLSDNKCYQELSSTTDLKKLAREGVQVGGVGLETGKNIESIISKIGENLYNFSYYE